MHAVIVAIGSDSQSSALHYDRPSPLLKIADKPILYHVLDWCVDHDVRTVTMILHHHPEMIRCKVGDGSRWGLGISYVLAKHASNPLQAAAPLVSTWPDGPILLAQGDRIPLTRLHEPYSKPTLFNHTDGTWTGWAAVSKENFSAIANGGIDQLNTKASILETETLSTASVNLLATANSQFLQQGAQHLHPPTSAREIDPGIWVCSNSQIHPSATIEGPVFLGRNSQIGAHVYLGPGTVIENNCIIDKGTVLRKTLVCQNTYVGEDLHLQDTIVDRQVILHIHRDTAIPVTDEVILCELESPSFGRRLFHLLERAIGAVLCVALSPLLLLLGALYPVSKRQVVHLPAKPHMVQWRTFSLYSFEAPLRLARTLPYAWSIVKGDLHFVGLSPRSPEEIEALPYDWQSLYLGAKTGWITPQCVEFSEECSEDERYIAEVFYTAHASPFYDLKLLWKWIFHRSTRHSQRTLYSRK